MKVKTKKPGLIKSAVLNWLGVPSSLADGDFWNWFYNHQKAAGQNVNQKTVLSLSAAWACTRLISECIATLPLHVYEKTATGRRRVPSLPNTGVLYGKPNANSTPSQFWEAKVAAILLHGNGLSEKRYIGNRLVALDFLAPHRISGTKKANGELQILYTDPSGRQREIPWSRLFHIAGFSLDGQWGLSAIQYGAQVFGSALAASTAANSTFEKGLSQTVAFTLDRVVKEDQREDFRKSMEKISGALNAGKSTVLEKGIDAKTIGINPRDAQLLESRTYSVEEVCRWFRVDPSMVGHGNKDSNWGTGLEQKLIGFLTFTLRPWLTRIEQAINLHLLSPAEQQRYYAEFSIEGLLRADSAARASFYSVMVDHGIFTRDEVRILENMEPRGGNADVLTVQSAMAPLDSLGQQSSGEQARAALAAWLNSKEDT